MKKTTSPSVFGENDVGRDGEISYLALQCREASPLAPAETQNTTLGV